MAIIESKIEINFSKTKHVQTANGPIAWEVDGIQLQWLLLRRLAVFASAMMVFGQAPEIKGVIFACLAAVFRSWRRRSGFGPF
jgi:hypothetical protein